MVWWVPSLINHIQNKTHHQWLYKIYSCTRGHVKWKTVEGVQSYNLGIRNRSCVHKKNNGLPYLRKLISTLTKLWWFDCSSVDPLAWFGYLFVRNRSSQIIKWSTAEHSIPVRQTITDLNILILSSMLKRFHNQFIASHLMQMWLFRDAWHIIQSVSNTMTELHYVNGLSVSLVNTVVYSKQN